MFQRKFSVGTGCNSHKYVKCWAIWGGSCCTRGFVAKNCGTWFQPHVVLHARCVQQRTTKSRIAVVRCPRKWRVPEDNFLTETEKDGSSVCHQTLVENEATSPDSYDLLLFGNESTGPPHLKTLRSDNSI